MKPKEAFGTFACIPAEPDLHPDWVSKLSFQARLIGLYIISKCKDPSDLRLQVGEDWKDSLCAVLAIKGPDRRNAKTSMQQLLDRGFLTVDGRSVLMHLTPLWIHSCSGVDPLVFRGGSTPDPKTNQVLENTQVEIDRSDRVERLEQKSSREPARETTATAIPTPTAAGACEVVDLEIVKKAAARDRAAEGSRRMFDATTNQYHPDAQRHFIALQAIATIPPDEWSVVAKTLRAEVMKPGVHRMLTPDHVLNNRHLYGRGEAPIGRKDIKPIKSVDDAPYYGRDLDAVNQ